MKAYSSEKCLPFDFYVKKSDPDDEFERLIEGQVIEGRFGGPGLDLEQIDHAEAEAGEDGSAHRNWNRKRKKSWPKPKLLQHRYKTLKKTTSPVISRKCPATLCSPRSAKPSWPR